MIQSVPNPQESRKDTYRVDFQSTSNQRITVSGTNFTYKADDVGDPDISGSRGLGEFAFNPAAFAQPAAGTFGNAGIKLLRAPRSVTADMALFKNVRFTDRFTTQVRVEAYNVFNHPLLDSPDVNPRSGTFGTITTKSGSRSLQCGVKLLF